MAVGVEEVLRMCGKDRRRLGAVLAAAGALALSTSLVATASPSFAETVTRRSVSSGRVWTDTGVRLRAGSSVTVTASGLIHFGAGRINQLSPTGIPWGRQCSAIAARLARGTGWPAPGLNCWSLIGRIGSGKPFEVGNRRTMRVARDGELFLGVNDNYLDDNSGTWSASITASAATTSPPTTAPSRTAAPAKHAGKSNTVLLVIVLLVLAALVALVVYWRRAVARRRTSPAPEPPESDENHIVTAAVPIVPIADAHVGRAAAPQSDEFVDVNIFQVDLVDRCALRVGYNYFPEGTVVSWKVTQLHAPRATGEFVTNGGGSTYHFVTVPLDTRLDADSDGADVLFTWTIGDVPFRYSVKRDPG